VTRTAGLAIGVVVDVSDPQGEGRVLLRYPDLPEEPMGAWTPIAAAMAGNGKGAFFMPEPGDEVLVGFHRGSTDAPYVVGFLHNGVDRPPESDAQNRVFVTRTGHSLRFEDGNKKVILKSGGGRTVTLDDNTGTITVETGGTSIRIDGSSITLLGGGRQLTMSGGSVAIT